MIRMTCAMPRFSSWAPVACGSIGHGEASAATMYGFEHAASSKDIYRVSEALVEQFMAGFASHRSSVAASRLPTE